MKRICAIVYPAALLKILTAITVIAATLYCTNVSAAYITMATKFSVNVKPDGLALVVMAENRGDVPAHDVQFEVILDDRVLDGPVEGMLGVDEKTSVEYSLVDLPTLPGRYPVVIRTYYSDPGGHRFTALTVGFFDYRNMTRPMVSIRGHKTRIPVDGTGRLEYLISNDGQKAQTLDLALYIPNELSVSREHTSIEIGPRQQETVSYDVENYSALASSSYPVSLVARYEDAGIRYAVAGSAVVRVAADARPTAESVWIWYLLGGLMPGVIIFLRWKRQK